MEFLPVATAAAYSFARRQYKQRNPQFIDEAIAEAWAIASEVFLEPGSLVALKERIPVDTERIRFVRATISHELQQYFACRTPSTLAFLRKKGIEYTQVPLTEGMKVATSTTLDERIAFEAVVKNELERRICRLRSQGWDHERISAEAGCTVKLVRKTLSRVRRALTNPSR